MKNNSLIGREIRKKLQATGRSIGELAAATGTDMAYISRVLSGDLPLSRAKLEQLIHHLKPTRDEEEHWRFCQTIGSNVIRRYERVVRQVRRVVLDQLRALEGSGVDLAHAPGAVERTDDGVAVSLGHGKRLAISIQTRVE